MAMRLTSFCLIYFIALQASKAGSLLSSKMPSDALVYFETKKISEFLIQVKEADFFQSLIESGDLDEIKSSDFIKDASGTFNYLELFLAKDIWVLNKRLLSGKMGIAAYESEESEESEEPEILLFIKPEETSKWLKNRIRFAPLLRLGIKRILKSDLEEQVFAYRTRGDKNDATYFALTDDWIIVTSSKRLLKDTVSLQGSKVDGVEKVQSMSTDQKYKDMTESMGVDHQSSLFLNIDKISKIDGRFGIPEKIEDPMLSLFLGGVINQLNASSYSGLTLNFDGKNLNFSVRVDKESDAGNVELSPKVEIISPPKVPGYLGGISVFQSLSSWYRERNDILSSQIIPGSDLLKGKMGKLLFGGSDENSSGYLGDEIVFLSAIANDAGKDKNGINLPGFSFLVDLAKVDDVEENMENVFNEMLSELEIPNLPSPLKWEKKYQKIQDVQMLTASVSNSNDKILPTPNCFRVGAYFCFSSSYNLSISLIEKIKNNELTSSQNGLIFDLDFNELTKFFSLNKSEYLSELSRSRGNKKSGERDYNNINDLLSGLKSISGSYNSRKDELIFDLEAVLTEPVGD